MTAEQKIHTLEKKITLLQSQMEYIIGRFGLAPDRSEYERAMEALMENRDSSLLDAYMRRGGKIPEVSPSKGNS